MDDLPDKLRRNVVVLSATILAITLFNLSFKSTGTLLGFVEVGNVTPLKVWTALLVVLIYMFLRYWFEEETGKQRGLLASEFQGIRYAAIQRSLRREVERFFLLRKEPRWLDQFENFDDEGVLANRFAAHGAATSVDISAVSVELSHDRQWWEGNVGYTFEATWGSHASFGRAGGSRYPYRLPGRVAGLIIMQSAFRMLGFSKGGVDVLVPMILAATAALACLVKLAIAL